MTNHVRGPRVGLELLLPAYLHEDESVTSQRVKEAVQLGLVGQVGTQGGADLVDGDRHAVEVFEEGVGNLPDDLDLVGDSRHWLLDSSAPSEVSNLPSRGDARVTRCG